jgi:intracellular septation protein A
MATAAIEVTNEPVTQPSTRGALRGMLPSIVVNGVLPFLLYQSLTRSGVAAVPALSAGAIFPIVSTMVGWLRTRRADVIGLISLFFIVIGVLTSLLSGDVQFTLLKESFLTGLNGLVFLGSLFMARPLMFYMARQVSTGGDPEAVANWNAKWQYPMFRHAMRTMTSVWGGVFLADALIRVALSFVLPVSTFLVVSQVMFYAVLICTIRWTMSYGRRMQRQADAAAAERV